METDHTTVITARIKDGETWSAAIKVALINSDEDYSGLKITELHYHPSSIITAGDTIDDRDMEFIEIKNTSAHAINISGIVFDSAISFTVPDKTILPPGNFFVVASKPEIFYYIYGFNPSGVYKGHFSNTGEYVLITDPHGNQIISFLYDDQDPWPTLPDGNGPSLTSELADPTDNPNDPAYWKSSTYAGGTPFANDDGTTAIEAIHKNLPDKKIRVFPNPAQVYITIQIPGFEQADLVIYNSSGKAVYSGSFASEITLPCNAIGSKGIYFIRINNKKTVYTEKIVIL